MFESACLAPLVGDILYYALDRCARLFPSVEPLLEALLHVRAGPRWVARLVLASPPLFDDVAVALVHQSAQLVQLQAQQNQPRLAPGLAARADALRSLAALEPRKRPFLRRLLVQYILVLTKYSIIICKIIREFY